MALDNTARQALKEALQDINPMTDDIIDLMAVAFETWVKNATITVGIPELEVHVDPKTGIGKTLPGMATGTLS